MKVQTVRLDDLLEDPTNARHHPESNMAAIRSSLANFGQVEPLVVQAGSMKVIGGNGRLFAMRELGWKKAEAVVVDLDDSKATALALALNRTAELAEWNYDNLTELLAGLSESGMDLNELGWSNEQLESLIASADWEPPTPEPKEPEEEDDYSDVEVAKGDIEESSVNVFVTVVLSSEDSRASLKQWCRDNKARVIK